MTPTNSDNEGGENEEREQSYYKEKYQQKFTEWLPMANHVPTIDLWRRQKQTADVIPPGILTPYIIDDVLEDLDEKKEESVKEQILLDKKKEAESNKELLTDDLPKYENIYKDVLLEKGNDDTSS